MAQVGEGALAADPAEHAGGQSLDGRRLQHCRDPARVNTSASVRTRLARVSVSVVAAGVERLGGVAEERGERAARTRSLRCGCSSASRRVEPLAAAAVWKTRAAGVDDRRHSDVRQGVLDGVELVAACRQHGDVARHEVAAVEGRCGFDQPLDVVGGVGDDVVAPQRHRRLGPRTLAEVGASYDAQPERGTRTREPGLGEVRLDGVDHDALVAELGAFEHGLDARRAAAGRSAS